MSRNSSLIARTVSHLAPSSESSAVEWAEKLSHKLESLISQSEANEAALLSGIGMAKHSKLTLLRTRILKDGNETLNELEARFKMDLFVSPKTMEPTVADAVLAWSAREIIDFVLEPSDRIYEYPSSSRWLEACLHHNAFTKALNEELVHNQVLDSDIQTRIIRGEVREGGQIDAKPRSTDARRAAERVKEINAGYKKQETQRQKEKAAAQVPVEAQAALTFEFILGEPIASSDEKKIEKCISLVEKITNEKLTRVDHPPAMDATNLSQALASSPGIKCKNLFLKCKKPRNETDSGLQLVCAPVDTQVDLKFLQNQLGYKDQLRLGAADLLTKSLDVVQGNVTPFALVNDPKCTVNVVLEESMMKDPSQLLWFHPLDNTASLGIPAGKLLDFIKASGRVPLILKVNNNVGGKVEEEEEKPSKDTASAAKKSESRGGEGAPTPTKKKPVVDTNSSPTGSPTSKKGGSFASPPKTLEEAIEREEQALQLVQERAKLVEEAKAVLAASPADPVAADKALKMAIRNKREADMIYGNAAGFTESLRKDDSKPVTASTSSSSKNEEEEEGNAAAAAAPLSLTLSHELAQDRLWARLYNLLDRQTPRRLEDVSEGVTRPVGHDTHNLLVKDSKSKKLYLICMKQSREVSLKDLEAKLGSGTLRLAGPADVENAIALTRGCITPLSLFNNTQASVTPVFDSELMAEPNKKLVICAGCDDALNHGQHNCVDITVNQMIQLINEAGKRQHIAVDF